MQANFAISTEKKEISSFGKEGRAAKIKTQLVIDLTVIQPFSVDETIHIDEKIAKRRRRFKYFIQIPLNNYSRCVEPLELQAKAIKEHIVFAID